MAKYKVGDKVRVRKDLRRGTDYSMADSRDRLKVNDEMIALAGKIVTISRIKGCGHYEIEGNRYCWTDEMFEAALKHEFRVGQKYRVNNGLSEDGNIIQITDVNDTCVYYRTIVGGKYCDSFDDNSSFARTLTPVVDDKIIITTDGVTVTAKRISDGKTATAKCSPSDKFDFEIGARLAFDRLMHYDFKIGDVVIADANAPYGITTNGWKGTVTKASDKKWIRVKDDSGSEYTVESKFFSLVTSTEDVKPEFKVGDFVKVTSESYGHHFPIGSTVKIETIKNRGDAICYGLCEWSDGSRSFGIQTVALESVEKL